MRSLEYILFLTRFQISAAGFCIMFGGFVYPLGGCMMCMRAIGYRSRPLRDGAANDWNARSQTINDHNVRHHRHMSHHQQSYQLYHHRYHAHLHGSRAMLITTAS